MNKLLDIEGTGGAEVPYHGYVELRLKIPQIKKFDLDILMLVINDSPYGNHVPVQIGTLHIDMMLDLASEEEKKRLDRQAERARMAQNLRMASLHSDDRRDSFDIKDIKGSVHSTGKIELKPFDVITVSGVLKGPVKESGFYKCVNVALEPTEEHKTGKSLVSLVPGYTFLKPGSNRVRVMLKNMSARPVTLHPGDQLANLEAANAIPHMLAPKEVPNGDMNSQFYQGARTDMFEEPVRSGSSEEELRPEMDRTPLFDAKMKELFEKINFEEGTKSWTPQQRERAKSTIEKYSFLFAMDSLDLGKTDLVKHHIELSNYAPIKDRYRRIPPHQYEEVRKHLKEMLEIGAIRRSNSPWASPVVLVRKKDGSLRFCIDLGKLNARTVKDAYSLPRIEDALDSLNGACIFTSLDLKSGYWQVELDDHSIPLTAFTVGPLGFYECVRMPFGLTNAPATFQRLMESCLGELHLHWCIIYLDDIIIFSRTPEDHIERLEGVFEKLAQAGLKLKLSKCEFFQAELKYLGHIVSKQGIATDPKKIQAIHDWPRPKTVTEVRSFMGFTNYYRKFIKGYAKIARPLHELVAGENSKRKHQKVHWDARCEASFEALKKICSEAPVLAYADYTKPFILHTDASTTGRGAVLYQKQDDGKERVIAYASRTLNKAERNYDAHKLEFLSLKWAITNRFHEYLYGATFDVFTDNNPLTYILTTAKLDAMGHRWVASLGPYDFAIHYKPGKLNTDADSLSRIEWATLPVVEVKATMDLAQVDRTGIVDPAVFDGSVKIEAGLKSLRLNSARAKWKGRQSQDTEIAKVIQLLTDDKLRDYKSSTDDSENMKSYLKVRKELVMHEGLLYRRLRLKDHDEDTMQFVVPQEYRKLALKLLHDNFGHLGIDRTTIFVVERFFWPKMSDYVRNYISNCQRCIRFRQAPQVTELQPIDATYPLQVVHMDFLQIGRKQDKNTSVLIVTDHFTRYAQAYVTHDQTAATVVKVFIDKFVTHYGWPERILTDQGQCFEVKLFTALCREARIRKMRTMPYHPMGNGQAERFNRTLLTMIGTLPSDQKLNWQTWVNDLVQAYNSSMSSVTGYSPYFLMFGRKSRLPVDDEFEVTFPLMKSRSTHQYVEKLKDRLQWAFKVAKEHIDKDQKRRKLYYDRKVHCMDIIPGELVLVRQKVFGPTHKIEDRWEIPVYKVLDKDAKSTVFQVQKLGSTEPKTIRTLHRNMLFSFISLMEDFEADPVVEVTDPTEPPASEARMQALISANEFMDHYFDPDYL